MTGYDVFRTPLIPLLHAPLQAILNALDVGMAVRLWFPHALQCVLTALCLLILYRFLRIRFSAGWAQLGVVLFSMNRLTVHYFGSVMPDIVSAALFAALLLAIETDRWQLGAVSMAASVASRWNMPVPIAGAFFLDVWRRRRIELRWLASIAAGAALFFCAYAIIYHRAVGLPWLRSIGFLKWMVQGMYETNQQSESSWTYAKALAAASGVVLIPFLWGAWRAVRERSKPLRFYLALFVFYGVAMTFAIGHKESRYLFPILPAFYVLALSGLQTAQKKWRFAAPAVLALAAAGAVWEWSRFLDPVFRNTIVLDTAVVLRDNSTPQTRLFWTGSVLSLYPERPVFIAEDPFYYLYTVPHPGAIEYLLDRTVPTMNSELFKTIRPGDLMVRTPHRPYIPGMPWEPDDGRIEIVRWNGKAWKPLVAFQTGRQL